MGCTASCTTFPAIFSEYSWLVMSSLPTFRSTSARWLPTSWVNIVGSLLMKNIRENKDILEDNVCDMAICDKTSPEQCPYLKISSIGSSIPSP